MRRFLVNVNGTSYEVAVEEIDGKAAAAAAAPATPAAPTAAPAAAAGDTLVKAPMPGNILSVSVKPGDAVKKGQAIMVLEAMKMENEILSPIDGTVVSVLVQQGASVNSDDTLCTLR